MEEKIFKPRATIRVTYIICAVFFLIIGVFFIATGQYVDTSSKAIILIFGVGFIGFGVLMIVASNRLGKFNIKVDDRGVTINKRKTSAFYSFGQYKFVTQSVNQSLYFGKNASYLLLITGYDGQEIRQNTNLSKNDFQRLVELIEQRKMLSKRENRTVENKTIENRFAEPSNFEEVFIQRREFTLNKAKIKRSGMNPVMNAVLAVLCFSAAYLLTFTIRERYMVYTIYLGFIFFIAIFPSLGKFLKNTKRTPDKVIVDTNSISFDNFRIPYNAITSIEATSTMQSRNPITRELIIHTAEAKYQYCLGFSNDGEGSKVVLAQDDYNRIIDTLKTAFVNRPDVIKMKFKG